MANDTRNAAEEFWAPVNTKCSPFGNLLVLRRGVLMVLNAVTSGTEIGGLQKAKG